MSGHSVVGRAVRGALHQAPHSIGSRYALAGLAALIASGGAAQEPGAQQGIEEVLVTGSRIARNTFSTPAPVTTIDAEQIRAVGATNLGEYLGRVPQTISEVNSSSDVSCGEPSASRTIRWVR